MKGQTQERWTGTFAWLFLVALIVWIVTAAILGIPHGAGHSIESMTLVQTLRDISLPIWIGSGAGIVGQLALRAYGATRPAPPSN